MKIGDTIIIQGRVEELRGDTIFARLPQGQGVELRLVDFTQGATPEDVPAIEEEPEAEIEVEPEPAIDGLVGSGAEPEAPNAPKTHRKRAAKAAE